MLHHILKLHSISLLHLMIRFSDTWLGFKIVCEFLILISINVVVSITRNIRPWFKIFGSFLLFLSVNVIVIIS
ncbi:hypothetical protein MtrunA17_Chr3g0090461 [Medicago truncatula]|uniref:Transmembrane protein n=1 Tax=Medicago truncatula TaxID=3880 RepID=A0A396ITX8_MEDTR|nr:hypothetical protein MtrunA17_Chr3g0090461 [Medicago truncatula]